jgi:GMP synthase-like glutamine amidotransferase
MSSAIILQHAAAFGPGRITTIFRDFGIPVQIRKLYAGDEVPTDLDAIRVLVSLGGPMRAGDAGSEQFPFLAKEVELMKRMIGIDRPILAIGLGSHLLAHSAGAKVAPAPAPELGWHPVTFPFPGGTEPMVMGMSDGSPMFHWHYDTFDLPRLPAPPPAPGVPPPPTGNALLSSSKLCKNQAFRFKTRLFGFQFHPELTESDIDSIIASGREELQKVAGPEGEKQLRSEVSKHYPRYSRLGEKLIRNFVQFTKTY